MIERYIQVQCKVLGYRHVQLQHRLLTAQSTRTGAAQAMTDAGQTQTRLGAAKAAIGHRHRSTAQAAVKQTQI
jgi:hypothetical protein